jgi:hypothetical protein
VAVLAVLALTAGGGTTGTSQVAGAFGSPAARARAQHGGAAAAAPSSRRPRAAAGARSGTNLSLPRGQRAANGRFGFGKHGLPQLGANLSGSYAQTAAGKKVSALPAASQRGQGGEEAKRGEIPQSQQEHQQLHAESTTQPPGSQTQIHSLALGAPPSKKSVSPIQPPHAGATQSGQTATPGAAPSNSASSGQSSNGSAGQRGGGSPAGGKTAGGQRAGTGGAKVSSRGGQTAGALPVQAGFAPVHSSKRPTSSAGPRDAQGGGGRARTAGVSGTAFVGGGSGAFGYVPPDAGVASGSESGLYERYLNALTRIQGLRW